MWSRTSNLVAARYWHTATLLQNGKVLVAGGQNVSQILKSTELYDPVSRTWNRAADLNAFRSEHTATQMQNGKVLVASGDDPFDYTTFNGTAEIYDPGSATWSYTGNLAAIRDGHTATLLPSGRVLVTGGVHFSTMNGAELYDPVSGTWIPTANVSTPRFYGHTATLLSDGKVLVAGGASETDNPTALASASSL
jgi:N-acetylneuraminic acid mutarotase